MVLKVVENTDWHLLQGDTDVRVEVRCWAGSLTPLQLSRAPFLSGAIGQGGQKLRIHLILNASALPGGLYGWEGLGQPKGFRGSQTNGYSYV